MGSNDVTRNHSKQETIAYLFFIITNCFMFWSVVALVIHVVRWLDSLQHRISGLTKSILNIKSNKYAYIRPCILYSSSYTTLNVKMDPEYERNTYCFYSSRSILKSCGECLAVSGIRRLMCKNGICNMSMTLELFMRTYRRSNWFTYCVTMMR